MTIAVVQSIADQEISLGSSIDVGPIATTTGNMLIVCHAHYNLSVSNPATLTDSKSNTWIDLVELVSGAQPPVVVYDAKHFLYTQFVYPCVGDANHVFTLSAGSTSKFSVVVLEISGNDLAVVTSSGTQFDFSTSRTSTAIAMTQAGLLIGSVAAYDDGNGLDASGWTEVSDNAWDTGELPLFVGHKLAADAGSFAIASTTSNSTRGLHGLGAIIERKANQAQVFGPARARRAAPLPVVSLPLQLLTEVAAVPVLPAVASLVRRPKAPPWVPLGSPIALTQTLEAAERRRRRRGWPPENPFTQMALEQRTKSPLSEPRHGSRRVERERDDEDDG